MRDSIRSQALVEYQVLRLPHVDHQLKYQQHALFIQLGTMVNGIDNRPLEIVGSAPLFFLLPLFWKARGIATEIVYRQKETRPAYAVSSFIEEDVIRPLWVIADLLPLKLSSPHSLPLSGMDGMHTSQTGERVMVVDLGKIWSEAQGKTGLEKVSTVLSEISSTTREVSRIRLQGEMPEVPALACVSLLARLGKKVEFEKIDFEQV